MALDFLEMDFVMNAFKWLCGRRLMLTVFLFAAFGAVISCKEDGDFTVSPSALLTFPTDTLALDTVLSAVSSPTYSFAVHNHTDKGIKIVNVALADAESSGFRVNVDGTFVNTGYGYPIEVRGHDSIAVWIDIKPRFRDSDNPVTVSDRLTFTLESGVVQQITLTAVTQDVLILENVCIDSDTCFSSHRPYFVKDTLRIAEGSTLTIAPGVKMMFAPKAVMLVSGTLFARGEIGTPVVFRGSRTDYMFAKQPYDRIPGQWGGIIFASASTGNEMTYCDIHGGTFGLRCNLSDDSLPKLILENSVVTNMKGDCLTLIGSNVLIGNSQITNAMGNTVTVYGGRCRFTHCTIANFYPFTGGRGKALLLCDSYDGQALPLTEAYFENCVLSGWNADELRFVFLDEPSQPKNYLFSSSLITAPASSDAEHFRDCVFESADDEVWGSGNFASFDNDALTYDFRLDTLSRARGIADTATTRHTYPRDLNGVERLADGRSDAGCYEFR